MRGRWAALAGFLAMVTAGCELTEVAAPASQDILVIDAVLRSGPGQQAILLHRSVDDGVVRGEPGASVVVTRADGSERIEFVEAPTQACLVQGIGGQLNGLDLEASCYRSAPGTVIEPGATYDLRVETTGGETAFGRTVVPGPYSFVSPSVDPMAPPAGHSICLLPAAPFQLAWTPAEGAWAYVLTLTISDYAPDEPDLPNPVELTSVSVSAGDTSLRFPTEIGLFQRGEVPTRVFDILDQGIPAGAIADLAVVATDRNYTNAIRGGRFNPSGNLRISSIAGDGVGVFGSVNVLELASLPESAPCPGIQPLGAGG